MRLLLLAAILAWGSPEDALDPVVRGIYLEGRRHEALGQNDDALVRYRTVLLRDPYFTHAVLDMARVLVALDRVDEAEEALRAHPWDTDAVRELGLLYLTEERYAEAAECFATLQDLAPEDPDGMRLEAEALAGVGPLEAAARFRQYLGFPEVDLDVDGVPRTAVRIHDALREAGEDDAAHQLLEQLVARWPEAAAVEGLKERLERDRVEDAARRLMGAGAQPLGGAHREAVDRARALHSAGEDEAALDVLAGVLDAVPRSPEAWALQAEVQESLGDIAGAEVSLQTALLLDPLDPAWHADLGDLLATWYGGRFDDEALEEYATALQHNPAWADVWLRRARVAQRHGDTVAAHAAYLRYLELEPSGEQAAAVQEQVEGFRRQRPPRPEVPPVDARPADVSEEAWFAFHVAEVYARQRHRELALTEIARVRELAPGFAKALNLEASLRLDAGEADAAVALYRKSLELVPGQPRVLEVLLRVYQQGGDAEAARDVLQEAADAGVGDAWYILATEAFEGGRPAEARAHLERYRAAERSGDFDGPAADLQDQLERRSLQQRWVGLGGIGGLAVLAPVAWVWHRSGSTVAQLLERAPDAWPDVARIASAVRHEVLKHNASMLPVLADALEAGDLETAVWGADKLLGSRGAVARFAEHVRALEKVGRVHGVRLNLRRDPVFGPLVRGMRRLLRLEVDLRAGRRRAAGELRILSGVFNQEGYRALGELVRRAVLLPVEPALLQGVWDQVRREPAFREAEAVRLSLDLPAETVVLRVYRSELEDILANLLRNALSATLEAGATPEIGLVLATEEDWITGLERVVLRVRDHAPRRLSTVLIRSRYVERGLGLTVDLISRNGGSIHVEDEPGWSKAVVVRLPRAEVAEEES